MLKRLQGMGFHLFSVGMTGVTPVFLMILIIGIFGNYAGVVFAQAQGLTLPNEPVMTLGQGYITNVQYSPDGKYLAVATSLGVELLETQNYQRLRFWDARARTISFSPDSRLLATAAWGHNQIRIFEIESGKVRILRERGPNDYCLSFRPDGKLLTFTDDMFIRVWDVDAGKEIKAVKTNFIDYRMDDYAFSPDGRFLAVSRSRSMVIDVLDTNTGNKLKELKGHTHWISHLAFNPDGKKLISITGERGEVILWDIESGAENIIAEGAGTADNSVAFSHDGKFLAWAFGNAIGFVVDMAKQVSRTLNAPMRRVMHLSFGPSNKLLAASYNELVVWDISTIFGWGAPVSKKLETRQIFLAPVRSISFRADGKFLASSLVEIGDIDLWDLSSGGRKRFLQEHTPSSWLTIVAFRRDGKSLFSVTHVGNVIEWDIESGTQVKAFDSGLGSTVSMALSPDNKLLALGHQIRTGDAIAISLLDTATGKHLKTLKTVEPNPNTYGLAFSPDGKVLVSAIALPDRSWKGYVRLWDVESGTVIKQLGEMTDINMNRNSSFAYSPDGSILASSSGGLILWDVATWKEVANLSPNYGPASVAFSPDGRLLAAGFDDGTIGLWDSGWRVNIPWKHTESVSSISFSGDGRFLASGSWDGTIKIWEISPQSSEPNNPPAKPLNLTPANKAENVALNPTLEASAFSDKDAGDSLRTSQWQITDKPGNYALPVFDSGVIFNDQVKFTVPVGILKPNTTYFWRVRYQDSRGKWSDYSAETSFKTTSTPPVYVQPSELSYSLSLSKGLNMISLPLQPPIPFTARAFAAKLNSTLVVEYDDAKGEFNPFLPNLSALDGFTIKAARGYIVNLVSPTSITFKGKGWSNAPPLEPEKLSISSQPTWAFVVGGVIQGIEFVSDINMGSLRVRVRNLNSNLSNHALLNASEMGKFAVALVDLSKSEVVREGDKIEILATDSLGKVVSGPLIRKVKGIDLSNAYMIVGMKIGDTIPTQSMLGQNYPNPFNPETWIPFRLSQGSEVSLQIYDVSRRLIRRFDLGHLEAGIYENRSRAVYWDGRNDIGERVASGTYYYRLQVGSFSAIRKLAILK